jgi:hypothetical protein
LQRLAAERLPTSMLFLTKTVDLATDEFDGDFSPGDLSLREAIFLTNNTSGPNTIQFAAQLKGAQVTLASELVITEDVTIVGPGPDKLTLSASGTQRMISVLEGFRNVPSVEIVGLKLSGANVAVEGAAIRSVGSNVIVRNCWITGNATTKKGGAVWVAAGTQNPGVATAVTIQDSTISGNSALQNGGGIFVSGGRLNLFNSTISGNSARDQGGGVFVSGGSVVISNSTIAVNRADSDGVDDPGTDSGGGIAKLGGNVTLKNSIVLGNLRGTGSTANDIEGVVAQASARNIIGHAGSAGGLVNGVNANLVGNAGTGALPISSVMRPTLTVSAGKTPTHNLVLTSAAIDSGLNSLAVDPSGAALLKDQRGISRIIDGDQNGVAVVDRGAVEFGSAPVVNLQGAITLNEQAAPMVLAPTATVTDADSPQFGGGRLTVSIAAATAADRLSIRNEGNAAGQIGVSGNQVRFGGTLIGTFPVGGLSPLQVTLNANATRAAAQALARNITIGNLSDFPPVTSRNVTFILTDDTGLSSAAQRVAVTIIPQNDAPFIGNQGVDLVTYNLVGNNPTKILALGTLADPDSPDFAGGILNVKVVQAAGTNNRLSVASPFSRNMNAGTLLHNGVVVGTVNANGGIGTTQLTVTFNGAATQSVVESLIKSVTFQIPNPTGVDEPTRRITVSVTDGDGPGGASNVRTISVDPEFIRG